MKANRLKHLYIEELKDLYSAETQLVKALPKMAKAAASKDLRMGFAQHLLQTSEHVARLETIFSALGESPKGKHCNGMKGLITEGKELMDEDPGPEELDAGLIPEPPPGCHQPDQAGRAERDRSASPGGRTARKPCCGP